MSLRKFHRCQVKYELKKQISLCVRQCPSNSIVTVKSQPIVPMDSQMHNNNNNIQQRTNIVDVQKVNSITSFDGCDK